MYRVVRCRVGVSGWWSLALVHSGVEESTVEILRVLVML